MPHDGLAVYEVCDDAPPEKTSHSRLFSLSPIRLGTPHSESLTSYIIRLAAAHCVTSQVLVKQEVIPLLGKDYLANARRFIRKDSRTLNGITEFAEIFVRALEGLTLRKDLRFLTLLPWSRIVDPVGKGLLKARRAWCPVCFHEWSEDGNVVYEPLMWSVSITTKCHIHKISFDYQCPECRRSQPFLASSSGIGFCFYCDSWLGIAPTDERIVLSGKKARMLNQQAWLADAVGRMIAVGPELHEQPSHESLLNGLNRCCGKLADGNFGVLADKINVKANTLRQWSRGRFLPRFDSFIDLCYRLNVTPVELLFGVYGDDGMRTLRRKSPCARRGIGRSRKRSLNKDIIRAALEAELEKSAPNSLSNVADDLQCGTSFLRYHWPELCKKISVRWKIFVQERREGKLRKIRDAVRQEMIRLYNQGIYPSKRALSKSLPKRWYLRENDGTKIWHETIKELEAEETRSR